MESLLLFFKIAAYVYDESRRIRFHHGPITSAGFTLIIPVTYALLY